MVDITPFLHCIQHVHPALIQKVMLLESGNNPLALHVNATKGLPRPHYTAPTTQAAAIDLANTFIRQGYSVDVGYMQVNSRNFHHYGVTAQMMFSPCKNLSVGADILSNAYRRALKKHPQPQRALRVALSLYNTGTMTRGFHNGYVSRYTHLIQ